MYYSTEYDRSDDYGNYEYYAVYSYYENCNCKCCLSKFTGHELECDYWLPAQVHDYKILSKKKPIKGKDNSKTEFTYFAGIGGLSMMKYVILFVSFTDTLNNDSVISHSL